MNPSPDELLIGAHCSAAGGVFNALLEGEKIGATTIQLFTANQRTWSPKELTDEVVAQWEEALDKTGIKEVMSHDSYLINLGAPNPEVLEKSRSTFLKEIKRCLRLGISYLNFHPGSYLKEDPTHCLDRIVESLLEVESVVAETSLTLLLETTAGQGSNMGWQFEELAYIIEKLQGRVPIGVCIDTCHIFAAGYDIRTAEGWDKTLRAFDDTIGLSYLRAFHVNDSLRPFASRKDRHAPLGEGEIGIDCFHTLMTDPRTRHIPKYLETPGGPERWVKEIKLLREFAKDNKCAQK
jgi:deoxyribonuclease-4